MNGNRSQSLTTAAVVIGALAACAAFFAGRAESAAPPPGPAVAWEYACVTNSGNKAIGCTLNTREHSIADVNAFELYRKLGGPKDDDRRFNLTDFTSLLGARGWELTAVESEGSGEVAATTYWFKRPVR